MHAQALIIGLLAGLPSEPLEPVGRVSHPAIREASGVVRSRRYPEIFWVHNDSGNLPALFAIRRDGSLVREYAVDVLNIDWEDIATDDDGHLYLGDIGNNAGRLPVRAIYRLDEPDPSKPAAGPLKVNLKTYYRFPRGGAFDAESLFIDGGRAIIVAKTFDRREAELFAIPLSPPAPLLRPALPEAAGSLPEFREPATGADLSADGLRLAVCGVDVARVYERTKAGRPWRLIGTVHYRSDDIEAICWDGFDLILVGEGRGIHRIAEAAWRGGKAGRGQERRAERAPRTANSQ
jgi:hypothetical protein